MSSGEQRFELPRGVREIEVRTGFAQVHIRSNGNLPLERIEILRILADAGISHKYLKLTLDGLAFIIADSQVDETKQALSNAGVDFEMNPGRSLILVHAIGMREEPGMLAKILQAATASGVSVDHIGDMHDKMFMVLRDEVAEDTASRIRNATL